MYQGTAEKQPLADAVIPVYKYCVKNEGGHASSEV